MDAIELTDQQLLDLPTEGVEGVRSRVLNLCARRIKAQLAEGRSMQRALHSCIPMLKAGWEDTSGPSLEAHATVIMASPAIELGLVDLHRNMAKLCR